MAIKIDKGIPAPLDSATLAHEMKGMEIGDSFLAVDCTVAQRGAYTRAAALLPNFILVSARVVEEGGPDGPVRGIRFWRAAVATTRKYSRAPSVKP